MDRLLVAFANEEAQRRIARLLESNGYSLVGSFFSGAEVIRTVHKLGSACVICGFKLRDMTANDLAAALQKSAALLVISSPVYLNLCSGENLFKLSSPLSKGDFFSSVRMLQQLESQTLHPPISRRKETEQRAIARAKELLMEINRMSENEAHRFLQKHSMDAGLRMSETAQLIIDTYSH